MQTIELSEEVRSDILWLLAKLHVYMDDAAFFGTDGARMSRIEHKYLTVDSK